MEIKKYKLVPEQDGYSLIVYVEPPHMEFSREFGIKDRDIQPSFRHEVKELIDQKFPNVKVITVKIVMGTMLLGAFPIAEIVSQAAVTQSPSIVTTIPYVTYVVQSGDSLYKIAAVYGITIDQIRNLNQLTSNTIIVGKTLYLPFVSYTVAPGDSLSVIAKRYYSTVDSIKLKNNLKSDTIFVGQRLLIPVLNPPLIGGAGTSLITAPIPTPTPVPTTTTSPTTPVPAPTTNTAPTPIVSTVTEYKVVSGDSLSFIAKRFNTTVSAIQTENNMTTDRIFIGQVLKIPSAPQPTAPMPVPTTPAASPVLAPPQTTTEYVVVGGDTLSAIAKRFNISVAQIMERNNLTTDRITVGQRLFIPATGQSTTEKDLIPPNTPTVLYDTIVNGKNVNSFDISGMSEANSKLFITVMDQVKKTVIKEAKAAPNGTFSTSLDLVPLQDGPITLSIFAEDEAGNKSSSRSEVTIKDTTGPSVLSFNPFPVISQKNASDYTISGQSEPNSFVDIKITNTTDQILKTVQADREGNFSFVQNTEQLKDGEFSFTAVSRDQYGNIGKTYEARLTKDTTILPVTNVEVTNNGIANKNNAAKFTIKGTSSEEGGIVRIVVSDGVNTKTEEALVFNGVFDKAIDLSSLNDGVLSIRVTQTDQAGNSSADVTTTILKDTVNDSPVVFTSGVERTTSGFFYKITGQGEPSASVEITVMGQTGTQEIKQTATVDASGRFEVMMNISSIAKPFVTMKQLDRAGNMTNDTIVGITSYIVGSGDTLWSVANRFNTTVDKLTTLNNLNTTVLQIGQQLKLPSVAGVSSPAFSEQDFFNMGYLYFGSSQTYIESVNKAANTINVVSPSYFDLNSDGTLKLTSQFDRQFIVSTQSAGMRVVPFLSNHWDKATGEKALTNRELLSTQIADTIRIYNLDGINVDIENVTEEYRDEYTDFIRLLREKIPLNKEVSVAVAANPNGYTTGWQGSYDYSELAKHSDYLMIMAYDESYPGSAPGPVASIRFVEQSIKYALNHGVPKDKIVLGVGHYGRYWKEGSSYGGDGISNFQIEKAVKLYNGTVTFDETTKSAKAVFTIKRGDPTMSISGKTLSEGTYTVWFENSAAIKAKIDLVHKYGIKGLGNWSLGQDNPQIWTDLSEWLQSGITPVTGETHQ